MAAQRLPWLQRHTARCQSSTQTVAQSASVTSAYPKRIAGSLVNWLNAAADDSAPIVIHTPIGALFIFGQKNPATRGFHL